MKKNEEKMIRLSPNQILSLKEKKLQINCISGSVWITYPNGLDRILKKGQSISISSKGKICVMAFAKSSIQIQKNKCTNKLYSSKNNWFFKASGATI